MWMDYSTIEIPDKGEIPSCGYFRYMVVLRGSGTFVWGDHPFEVALHSFFTIPQETVGRMEGKNGQPVLLGSIEIRDHNSTSQGVTVLSAEATEIARRIFFLGLDIQECELPYYDTVKAALHQMMFAALMAAGLATNTMNKGVFAVIQDINHHFTETDYDVRKAIEQSGYTMNHFRNIFRKEIGITPTEFVTARRLDRAEELFSQVKDRIPVKDVALQCGFQDPYYFSRQFKKRRGISPQAYIRELKEQEVH